MVVLFDLNGTLTDLAPIGAPWDDARLGRDVLDLAVRGGMVDSILDAWHPFPEHLRTALETQVARRGLDPGRIPVALDAAETLPAHPDAAATLARLRADGRKVAVLTNSGARAGRRTLDACELLAEVDDVFGVDAVRTFKPDARAYRHALQGLRVEPKEVVMVAAHAWDLAGAAAVGMRTAWVGREEHAWPATLPEPDVAAPTLLEVADLVVERL